MQQAIPEREYSADERAERARGGVIAFFLVVAAGVLLAISALLLVILFR